MIIYDYLLGPWNVGSDGVSGFVRFCPRYKYTKVSSGRRELFNCCSTVVQFNLITMTGIGRRRVSGSQLMTSALNIQSSGLMAKS